MDGGDEPAFVRIARGIADDVRRGRFRAGDALPGTRPLATTLGVSRNTVVAAYRELVAEGWAVTRRGGGTFVAEGLPDPPPRRIRGAVRPVEMASAAAFPLHGDASEPPDPPETPRGTLVMAGGVPDVRLVPVLDLARALRRVLTGKAARGVLGYGDPRGDARLRAAVADLVRERRGIAARPENVLIVRGSQMALELVARAVLPGGRAIAVEAIGYRPAWTAFARAGARVVPIPIDRDGLDVDALAAVVRREPIAAVYVTPHHHYPTTVTLGAGRRLALLGLARRASFAVIEDDYDHELHYEGRPVLPLASADVHGSVVYVGTLSKVVAPGLRLGYVVAPEPVIERLARERFVLDRQGDHVAERAVAEMLEDGTVARHVRRMRSVYALRRDLLVAELGRAFGGRIDVRAPPGGMALWARVDLAPHLVAVWERRAAREGVVFAAGERFVFDGGAVPFARFGFASLDERELREAVRRLARAFPRS